MSICGVQAISRARTEDSKRTITVELLQRPNIHALAEDAGLAEESAAARNRGVHHSAQPMSAQAEFVMERPSAVSHFNFTRDGL
jgi:hypothetical protein